ncbi:MAG: dUTP diphosphatase [Lentisphaeria bacterium]|nr:dUTP diphosphatase [Lentisphaeria bacterium]
MEVKIKLENGCENFCPKKAHPDDAGYDLYSRIDAVLEPLSGMVIPVGFAIELPTGYEAQIRPRSGLAAKHHITVTNSPGTVDANYRGEIKAILYNLDREPFIIQRGDRIAQMVICKLPEIELVEATELSETDRGSGGFGSSGK